MWNGWVPTESIGVKANVVLASEMSPDSAAGPNGASTLLLQRWPSKWEAFVDVNSSVDLSNGDHLTVVPRPRFQSPEPPPKGEVQNPLPHYTHTHTHTRCTHTHTHTRCTHTHTHTRCTHTHTHTHTHKVEDMDKYYYYGILWPILRLLLPINLLLLQDADPLSKRITTCSKVTKPTSEEAKELSRLFPSSNGISRKRGPSFDPNEHLDGIPDAKQKKREEALLGVGVSRFSRPAWHNSRPLFHEAMPKQTEGEGPYCEYSIH